VRVQATVDIGGVLFWHCTGEVPVMVVVVVVEERTKSLGNGAPYQ
jgi:hypothetical protein